MAEAISIIVNADDVGIHRIFTDGSFAALEAGGVTTMSVITPGDDADRAMSIIVQHPEWQAGVHLCLNGGWVPLTPADQVPSLVNDRGVMWDTFEEVAANVRPEEARVEWNAQIRKALDAGLRITHLDSHMGCYYAQRELFIVALELSQEYSIPMIASFVPDQMEGMNPDLLPVASYEGIYQLPDAEETLQNRAAAYHEFLANLGPGTHYIFSHHALPDAEDPELGDLPIRRDDFAYWTGDLAAAHLAELGITRTGTDGIRERFLSALP